MRRTCLSEIPLVLSSPELLLEPIDHVLERVVVLMVEEVATWLHLDELLHELLLRNVGQDDVLRVLVEDCELVRDARGILLLLLLECLLELIKILTSQELRVLGDFSKRSVAGCDVSLYNFLQIFVRFVADPQLRPDVGTDSFLVLADVDVHNIRLVELPGESDVVRSS